MPDETKPYTHEEKATMLLHTLEQQYLDKKTTLKVADIIAWAQAEATLALAAAIRSRPRALPYGP